MLHFGQYYTSDITPPPPPTHAIQCPVKMMLLKISFYTLPGVVLESIRFFDLKIFLYLFYQVVYFDVTNVFVVRDL